MFATMIAAPLHVPAADLKISLSELARILAVTLQNPRIRLHNVPGGFIDMAPSSSLGIGSATVALKVDPKSFEIAGATYGYYVNELNSQSVSIAAVPSALRIAVVFESADPEIVGRCITGLCVASAALPQLQWQAPSITIDLTPVWVNGKLSLDAKRVEVGGSFLAECLNGGFFAGSICKLALPKARGVAATLKTEVAKNLKDLINGPQAQAQIAEGLKPYLRFGPVGEVRFSKVAVDSQNVTISFCLACQAQ